ncbi:MAG: hypothetical protein MPN21_22020 [Thermoanaerobaculia bacterium]|nr:hypothetical protein [Thermoanaerobaculia bacterium]
MKASPLARLRRPSADGEERLATASTSELDLGTNHLTDENTPRLPSHYEGLHRLQQQFDSYQKTAFPFRPSRFFSLELCGEAGELANLEKKEWKGKMMAAEEFQDEAADVCIALLNYANSRGVDLAAAVETKMAEIERRRVADES